MNFDVWVQTLPEEIKKDALWKVEAYRLSLFLSEICWHDVSELIKDHRTRSLADQLYRAVGSVSANIAEGYSKSTGRDRARFYEYALGSARESRDWYYKSHHILREEVITHRIKLTTQIIRLLLTMVPQQRASKGIREEQTPYEVDSPKDLLTAPMP
jgi:four helix bundle protein